MATRAFSGQDALLLPMENLMVAPTLLLGSPRFVCIWVLLLYFALFSLFSSIWYQMSLDPGSLPIAAGFRVTLVLSNPFDGDIYGVPVPNTNHNACVCPTSWSHQHVAGSEQPIDSNWLSLC